MEEDRIEKLRNGEQVLCEVCKNGYYIPYNTSADKAHNFNCSNESCNNFIHIDPIINIE